MEEFRDTFLPASATFAEVLPNHECCSTRDGKLLAAAIYRPADLIKSVDDCASSLQKVSDTEDCLFLASAGYCQSGFHVCLDNKRCECDLTEHCLTLKWHQRLLLSNCVRSEEPDIPNLIHVIFARDPKRPDFRLQISHYCLLQSAEVCCHPQHFALESDRDNRKRASHQHGTTTCDCKQLRHAEPCRMNGNNIKVFEDGVHITWKPRFIAEVPSWESCLKKTSV